MSCWLGTALEAGGAAYQTAEVTRITTLVCSLTVAAIWWSRRMWQPRRRIAGLAGKGFQHEHDRGQALLAVDNQQRRLAGNLVKARLDVDDGADKVGGTGLVATHPEDVLPELMTLGLRPGVGSLVDGNNELWRLLEEVQQLGLGSFHRAISPSIRRRPRNHAPGAPRASSSCNSGR